MTRLRVTSAVAGAIALGVAGIAVPAGAVTTISLETAPTKSIQQTSTQPCIISGVNCNNDSFPLTQYSNTGSQTSIDLYSPEYDASTIIALVGTSFDVGLDVQDTNVAQSLDLFQMYIDGILVSEYAGPTDVPSNNPGAGFADYLLTDLPDISGASTVQFRAVMSNMNDGPDQFFLVNTVSSVPAPAALPLLLSALAGLGYLGRRRRLTTA